MFDRTGGAYQMGNKEPNRAEVGFQGSIMRTPREQNGSSRSVDQRLQLRTVRKQKPAKEGRRTRCGIAAWACLVHNFEQDLNRLKNLILKKPEMPAAEKAE